MQLRSAQENTRPLTMFCITLVLIVWMILGSETSTELTSYSLKAPSPHLNTFRMLRAMQLGKPLLLEGAPGVGKTSLVTALAKASGHHVVRINLSEHTVSRQFVYSIRQLPSR